MLKVALFRLSPRMALFGSHVVLKFVCRNNQPFKKGIREVWQQWMPEIQLLIIQRQKHAFHTLLRSH